jgi:hypothetical protein
MNETKVCCTCKQSKLVIEFYMNKSGKRAGKPRAECIECERKYRSTHKHLRDQWKEANPDYDRRIKLNKNFGLSLEKYNEMLHDQGYKCKVCGIAASDLNTNLCVDHNHSTKKVRGLLCSNCNTGLGMFKDNPTFLFLAATYLNENN